VNGANPGSRQSSNAAAERAAQHIHASLVTVEHERVWHGILIEGKSGAGKSSVAMGVIEAFRRAGGQAFLVSDDQVLVEVIAGIVTGHAPPTIAGKIEIRGHGIAEAEFRESAAITLVVHLRPENEIERMPEARTLNMAGQAIPLVEAPERHEAQAVRIVQAALTGRHF
jgi:serine kinase of HPr protein (carbohydrate metabolism regulator)